MSEAGPRVGSRARWRRTPAVLVAGGAVLGVAVGVAWRLLTPLAAARVEGYEVRVAGDVTLAALEVLVGLLVGLLGLLRPGPGAAGRFVGAVRGSGAGRAAAWGVGRLLAAPTLTMPSLLLLWPLTVGAVTVVATLVATLVLRDPYDDGAGPPPPRPG